MHGASTRQSITLYARYFIHFDVGFHVTVYTANSIKVVLPKAQTVNYELVKGRADYCLFSPLNMELFL